MVEYPEHEKLKNVADKSQMLGEFLEWMFDQGFILESDDTVENILARYLDIDLKKIEAEKRLMLNEMKKQIPPIPIMMGDGKHHEDGCYCGSAPCITEDEKGKDVKCPDWKKAKL